MKTILVRAFKEVMLPVINNHILFIPKCAELRVVVGIVVEVDFAQWANLEFCGPVSVDFVTAEFLDLKIILTRSGWPRATILIAVVWKNPNVNIDIAGIMHHYIGIDGAVYEPIFRFGNSVLRNRILWGTDWPLIDIKRSVSSIKELLSKEAVLEKWDYKDGISLFGL